MQADKVVDHIVNWLKEYATNAKMSGFVIGISGGIDSALTSTLCAKTGFPTLCIRFPNVSSIEVNLTPFFETFKTAVPDASDNENLFLSLANARARMRMTTLYYFAGLHKYLVAGTGNKVEDFGVGFYTKYGDGGVDLSPIADLMKSEVYRLAAEVQVPESIQQAKPTDGLWGDDRTDEDQIGATYDQLEWAMLQDEMGKEDTDFEGEEKRVFTLYKKLNNANQHKMMPIPVCKIPVHLFK